MDVTGGFHMLDETVKIGAFCHIKNPKYYDLKSKSESGAQK